MQPVTKLRERLIARARQEGFTTASHAAMECGVSRRTIYRWLARNPNVERFTQHGLLLIRWNQLVRALGHAGRFLQLELGFNVEPPKSKSTTQANAIDFGRKVRQARTTARLTQSEFAARLGIPASRMSRIEAGRRLRMPAEERSKIERLLLEIANIGAVGQDQPVCVRQPGD